MPSLAPTHPIVVHFAIALLVAGAVFRWLSLTGRIKFASPAATSLLLVGTVAAFLAVKSGTAAHGPVERIPGVVDAVIQHERWGERTQYVFFAVAFAEVVLLLLARRGRERPAVIASAVLCLPAVFCLYEAAEHGGELVYEYAGGPGLRRGNPEDVGRMLVAGVHNQVQVDRKAGRSGEAAALVSAIAPRFASDPHVQIMAAESALLDRKDPAAALDILGRTAVPQDNARLRIRHGLLMVDALDGAGRPDAARATLQQLASAFPENGRIKQRLAGSPAPARY
jgi:uncharacterized membrane protein